MPETVIVIKSKIDARDQPPGVIVIKRELTPEISFPDLLLMLSRENAIDQFPRVIVIKK